MPGTIGITAGIASTGGGTCLLWAKRILRKPIKIAPASVDTIMLKSKPSKMILVNPPKAPIINTGTNVLVGTLNNTANPIAPSPNQKVVSKSAKPSTLKMIYKHRS